MASDRELQNALKELAVHLHTLAAQLDKLVSLQEAKVVIADPGQAGIAMAKQMHPGATIVQKTRSSE